VPTPHEYYAKNKERFLEDLKAFLRIPSISTLPEHKADIEKAARFVLDDLRRMGLTNARLIEGLGHPLVYAEWLEAKDKPTLVIYGHYDVQPADPLEEWKSPPFEPEVRGDDIFARGAVDDKGQLFLLLKAVEGHLKTNGRLPINVKFLIEGEEECGGHAIESYLSEHGAQLGAAAALVSDTEMFAPGLPTLCVGLRGLVYTEIDVQGARTDLHSGIYGGAAPNPLQAIAEILTRLKDPAGKILIPGFYDDLEPPSAEEKQAWARLPFDEQKYLETEIGSSSLTGEKGFSALERTWARPTLEVHGIRGGFTGQGAKTVIPARASVKVSMRLAPAMDPERIFQQYREYVESLAPRGIRVSVRLHSAAPASVVRTDHPFIETAAQALDDVFKQKTVYIRSGGSIPVVGLFDRYAGIPSVLMGFGLPDDNLHAPNEKFHLPNFFQGIEAVGHYLELLGQRG
jgi:acetylornithine deacetylase/succinyl-diaminopimelate desuccinylase-like protein